MVFSRDDLKNQLRRREFAPVYVLFGPETHLRDKAAKTIADLSFAPGDLRDFNETSFSLNTEGNLEKALAAAQQLPMLAARRVVRINELRISASGYRDTLTESHEPLLTSYLADPSPHTVVILVADELNGVRKMGKYLREKTAAVEFLRLGDKELAAWARKEFAAAGVSIDDYTLNYFLTLTGSDVLRMTNEIKKLSTASIPKREISVELIKALVSNTRELTNYRLTDHLVAGNSGKALATLKKILEDGAEPVALLGLLSYSYRRLLIAKDLMDRGMDSKEVASSLKLRYNDQGPFIDAARRSDLKSLTRAIKLLADTDVAIKTSSGGPDAARMQLEVLVCELALS
jgi:DNA polymerase III subunit delta